MTAKKKTPTLKTLPKKNVSDEKAGQLKGGMLPRADSSTGSRDMTSKSQEVDEG